MKKENITYKLIDSIKDIDDLLFLHKLIYINTPFENKLIYFDKNYKQFLENLILNKNNKVFFYGLYKNEDLIGFIQFRLIESYLFLNNISLDNKFRGKGLGSLFLKKSLKNFEFYFPIKFKLDVFNKNLKAKSWYKKIGLEQEEKLFWYQKNISISVNQYQDKPSFKFTLDQNGFESIFDGTSKIATVINKKNLIVHNNEYLDLINYSKYDNALFTSKILLPSKEYYLLLDISYRLSSQLKKVMTNLDN